MNSVNTIVKSWVIYKITSPSGNIYIGKSSNYTKRLNYYRNMYSVGQKRLHNSFVKHGVDSHLFEVIDTFYGTADEASSKEMFWIRSFMSNSCKWPKGNGLNLTNGGEGTIGYKFSDEAKKRLSEMHKKNPSRGMLGKKLSEETKRKLSEYFKTNPSRVAKPKSPNKEKNKRVAWNKGVPMSDKQKELLRSINTGRPSWSKGVPMSDDVRKKVSEAKKGHTYLKGIKQRPEVVAARAERLRGKPQAKKYKAILQYDLNWNFIAEYESMGMASQATGVPDGTIRDIAKGGIKKPSTFYFKYKTK